MQDAQGMINGGLNAAMMVAFAVPGGQAIGAGFAVFTAVLNACWPDADTSAHPVTEKELQDSPATLQTEIASTIYGSKIDDMVDHGHSLFTGFQNKCETVKRLLQDPASLALPDADQDVSQANTFFDLDASGGYLDQLRTARNAMELSSQIDPDGAHRTRTVDLYSFVSMFICAYLKAAVTWEWGYKLGIDAQFDQYQKDVADWRAHDAAYKTLHPFDDLIKKYPGLPSDKIPQRNEDWAPFSATKDGPVQQLFAEVQHMIDYLSSEKAKGAAQDGLYTFTSKNWDDLDTQISALDVAISPGQQPTAAQVTTGVSSGVTRAKLWDSLMESYQFKGDGWQVTEADIDGLKDTIGVCKTAIASVRFQIYSVMKKDTFDSIAQKRYRDPSCGVKIFNANRKVFPNDNAPNDASLTQGLNLKIFSRDDIELVIAAEAAAGQGI